MSAILAAWASACLANLARAALRCLRLGLGGGDELLGGRVGQRVATRVAADRGAAVVEQVGAGGPAGAAQGAGLRGPGVGADQRRVGRGHRAAGGDGERRDAEQDGKRGQAPEERAARAGVPGRAALARRPASTRRGAVGSDRDRGPRGTAAGAASVRSVVTHACGLRLIGGCAGQGGMCQTTSRDPSGDAAGLEIVVRREGFPRRGGSCPITRVRGTVTRSGLSYRPAEWSGSRFG